MEREKAVSFRATGTKRVLDERLMRTIGSEPPELLFTNEHSTGMKGAFSGD